MTYWLVALFGVALLGISYTLLQKQNIYFSLIPESEENQTFLHNYGLLYAVAGVLAFIVTFISLKTVALLYLILVLIVASVFSITFSRKMHAPSK